MIQDDDEDTVVITECKTGGAPGCVCAWCALMGPTPEPTSTPELAEPPRPRSTTGPQPSAAYLERIADAALEARQRR